jgi:hypothetical protein
MASERQIAANRRNARKSTGPRSSGGRKRASRNAYRHGLTLSISSTAAFAKQLDKLVHKIAGDIEDEIVLERARAVAQAELELARVRRAKVALIDKMSTIRQRRAIDAGHASKFAIGDGGDPLQVAAVRESWAAVVGDITRTGPFNARRRL